MAWQLDHIQSGERRGQKGGGADPTGFKGRAKKFGKGSFYVPGESPGISSPPHPAPSARARHTLGAQYMLVAFQVKAPVLLNEGVSLCCPLLVASSEASGK